MPVISEKYPSFPAVAKRLTELFSISACALLFAIAITGCRKEKAVAVDDGRVSDAAVTTGSEAKPVAAPVVLPAVSPQNSNSDVALAELSLALRRYVVQTKRAPKSFEEFIAQTHIQPPPPPAGQKYAIKSGAVVLVKL